MTDIIVPKRPEQHEDAGAPFGFVMPDEQRKPTLGEMRASQIALREKLRYRNYERNGTLSDFLQRVGNQVRAGDGPWFWVAVGLLGLFCFGWLL